MMFYHKLQKWALGIKRILDFKVGDARALATHEDELKTVGRGLDRLGHGSLAGGVTGSAGDRCCNAGDGNRK
jgi:hypothetical protein